MFGIKLTENFNSPYLATSIADFWRRWHISFSRWILDYIFKPLQMGWRNWGRAGIAAALIITFLVSGIWHGASKGFVIWGLLHGIYLASSTYYRPYQKRLHKWLGVEKSPWLKWWQVFVTFNLVSLAWVFFRAPGLKAAWYVISHSVYGVKGLLSGFLFSQGKSSFVIIFVLSSVMLFVSNKKVLSVPNRSVLFRWSFYYALAVSIVFFGQSNHANFIYARF